MRKMDEFALSCTLLLSNLIRLSFHILSSISSCCTQNEKDWKNGNKTSYHLFRLRGGRGRFLIGRRKIFMS